MTKAVRSSWRDTAIAALLAAVMSAGWAWARWADLRGSVLPDTDDLMRLQQIRDWLAGQGFADLTQHRLGVGGVAMHWSRLPDLVPAAILSMARPMLGAQAAELAAVLLWPALLLAAFLALAAAVARRIDARPIDAMIVALLAYPATTVFAPGRIDHHGLQLVLLLGAVLGLTGRASVRGGAVAGAAAIASVVIGMETVPLLAAAIGAALVRWTRNTREDARLAGLGIALGLGGIVALAFATDSWRFAACDGFNRQSWSAVMAGATAVLVLAALSPRLNRGGRTIGLVFSGIAIGIAVAAIAPGCLDPYGAVDRELSRLWLSQVAEAQGLLHADPRWAVAYAGLTVAAILFGLGCDRGDSRPERRILLAVALASLALSFIQIRAAYGGAAVAAPLLADAIGRMRWRGVVAVLATRIAATGIAYPIAASALPVHAPPAESCDTRPALDALRRLPPARVLSPIDDGPTLIVTTRHQVIAGPYHRNTAGNLAALRFDAQDAAGRRGIEKALRIDYRVGCSGIGLVPTGVPGLWRTR